MTETIREKLLVKTREGDVIDLVGRIREIIPRAQENRFFYETGTRYSMKVITIGIILRELSEGGVELTPDTITRVGKALNILICSGEVELKLSFSQNTYFETVLIATGDETT